MNMKFFNKHEFSIAISFIETNPSEAKIKFEEYLRKYPKDYCAYLYYASVLITLGETEDAERVVTYIENTANNDQRFLANSSKLQHLERDLLYVKLKLLSFQERYAELHQLCAEHFQEIKEMELEILYFLCKKKLGKPVVEERFKDIYTFKQIENYSESEFLEHIKSHLSDYSQLDDDPSKSLFIPNFPINEVLKEIRKNIPSNLCLFTGFFQDVYVFKYEGCGRHDNKLVDYFKVVCFHNTSDIITIFPASGCKDLPHIDLTYLIDGGQRPQVKRISQIDKFKKRFNIE